MDSKGSKEKSIILEFESDEFQKFKRSIREASLLLIEKTIGENCPVKVGDIVESENSGILREYQISSVKLAAVNSWWELGSSLSFYFDGRLVTKKGKIAKGRLPVYLTSFTKDGVKYFSPSYDRIPIASATMKRWLT